MCTLDLAPALAAEVSLTLAVAAQAHRVPLAFIREVLPPEPACAPGDYYSNGEYWWPDPDQPAGLPYHRRDGYENPQRFKEHSDRLRRMAGAVSALAAGYAQSGEERWAARACQWLEGFFVSPATRMNPHLCYAQAVPGRFTGRSFGIIDTRALIELPQAIDVLSVSSSLSEELEGQIRQWFRQYLYWMCTHPHGVQEKHNPNNHGTCWTVQVSAFARFVEDQVRLDACRAWFKNTLLPSQMACDGSFPRELARTRPYSYSLFNLEQMVMLGHLLSTPQENLWTYAGEDGRSLRRGLAFLDPYLADRSSWPYGEDVECADGFPHRATWLLIAAQALQETRYLDRWHQLPALTERRLLTESLTCRYAALWLAPPRPVTASHDAQPSFTAQRS